MKQKSIKNKQKKLFNALGQDSPQKKTQSPPLQDIEELKLQDAQYQIQKPQKKVRRNKLKGKQTNIIKIKPVQKCYDNDNVIRDLSDSMVQQKDLKLQQTINQILDEKQADTKSSLQSPVLYKMSDDEDMENDLAKQQDIPQSSRRPLNERKMSQKKSDSDEIQSPGKLLKSTRKARGKFNTLENKSNSRKQKRNLQKMKFIQQKIQKTEVYNYNDDQKKQESSQVDQNNEENIQLPQTNQTKEREFQLQQKANTKNDVKNQIRKILQQNILVFKSNSFFTLMNAQIPLNSFVNCIIKRKRTEQYFQKLLVYECYLLQDKKYLMTCIKNRFFKTTSHFQFYRQRNSVFNYNKQNLYGILDSNFTGTQFVFKSIPKNDTNSQKSTTIDKSDLIKMEESTTEVISQKQSKTGGIFQSNEKDNQNNSSQLIDIKETCFISFKANFFGLAGQRQIKVLKKKNRKLKKTGNFSDLKSAQQNGEIDKFVQFQNRKALIGKNGLQLDFKGVAKIQSTKNFLLQNQNSKQILIFGKAKEDLYLVSIGNPLSILEGLAIGIANLDRKFFVN